MAQYFKTEKEARAFVEINLERKQRNLICRKVRLYRKARLQPWNFFCTFTYDNAKHTEESFRKKLADTFKKMCYRRGWKYIGVWERSAEKEWLHFHGLFYIPDGQMVGELFEVKDYSPKREKVQKTVQNTYFNERFGRSDFEAITSSHALDDTIGYILKYIQKSDTKIICQPRIIQTSVLRRVFRLILCSATAIYGCIMPFARRVLAWKRAAGLAGNQNVAIFNDFRRRRLCSYLLYGRRQIRHKARKYRRFGGVRIILGWHTHGICRSSLPRTLTKTTCYALWDNTTKNYFSSTVSSAGTKVAL